MNDISTKSTIKAVLMLVLSLMLHGVANAQWNSMTPQFNAELVTGQAFDSETFVVAGGQSTVIWGYRDEDNIFRMKGTDVGEEPFTIRDLHAFSPGSALVLASNMAYISTDRGSTWQETLTLDEELANTGFFDDETGFITTNGGSIWRSTDAGDTWNEAFVQSGASWKTAVTISDSHAVVAGSNGWIAYTSDAGETWSTEQPDSEISFVFSGYDDGMVYLLDTVSANRVIYTLSDDNLSEVSLHPFEPPRFLELFDIRNGEFIFFNSLLPVAGGEWLTEAYRFADSGNGWELTSTFEFSGETHAAPRIPDSNSHLRLGFSSFGVVGFENGVVTEAYDFYSAEGSGNPLTPDTRQLVKTEDGIVAFGYSIYECYNGGECRNYYTLRISEDSRVWKSDPNSSVDYASFRESGSGLVFRPYFGDGNRVFFTNDFGVTSENLDFQTPEKVAGAVWLDDSFLVAAGEDGAIMYYDGSDFLTSGSAGGPLTGITKLDENTAIAVGLTGRAVSVNRSGEITTFETPTDVDLNAVYAQGDVILTAGMNGTILRSSDEGNSWVEIITSTEADLYAIALHESGNGFATGAAGTLLKTTDAGMVWEEGDPLTESTLRTILISDMDNIWLAGDDGAIFYSDTGGFTSITDPNQNPGEIPKEISLKHNYPNPFNPTTNVVYELSEAVDVRLEVFNVLGQRISVLHNGMQTAGTHTASFDGSGLSSGIYLVRMQAGGQVFTNKMMLVK
jgi:photosystem II stability/assembly factor-like uncharacterized protein